MARLYTLKNKNLFTKIDKQRKEVNKKYNNSTSVLVVPIRHKSYSRDV